MAPEAPPQGVRQPFSGSAVRETSAIAPATADTPARFFLVFLRTLHYLASALRQPDGTGSTSSVFLGVGRGAGKGPAKDIGWIAGSVLPKLDVLHSTRSFGMRTKGTVKWFNDSKGFGFITPENGSKDCFVHHTAIQGSGFKTLAEGEQVEFDLIDEPKGPKATNVSRLG